MSYQPQLQITPALLARVEAIAAVRERIQSATVQVSWIPALQKDTRARNAHSSTAIEGNPLTLEEVRLVESRPELLPVASRARREVLNYFAALHHLEKHAAKKRLIEAVVNTHVFNHQRHQYKQKSQAITAFQSFTKVVALLPSEATTLRDHLKNRGMSNMA